MRISILCKKKRQDLQLACIAEPELLVRLLLEDPPW